MPAAPLPGHEALAVGRWIIEFAPGPGGLRHVEGERVVLGRSLLPLAPEHLRLAADTLRAPRTCAASELPAGLVWVLVLDGAAGRVRAWVSPRHAPPLLWHAERDAFRAAGGLRTLGRLGVSLVEDEAASAEFLLYRFVTPPRTLCRGVLRLAGGTRLTLDLATGTAREDARERVAAAEPEASDAYLARLDDALSEEVHRALAPAERPALLLSGGIDSLLLGSVARDSDSPLGSLSSSFAFADTDDGERGYAESAAQHLGLEHVVHEGSAAGYLVGFVDAMNAVEEPLHHLQSVMLHLLFRDLASARHDVLLCGEGADGIFGTEGHRRYAKYRSLIRFLAATGLRRPYAAVIDRFSAPTSRWRQFSPAYDDDLERADHALWRVGRYVDAELARAHAGIDPETAVEGRRALLAQHPGASFLDRVSILGLGGEVPITIGVWGRLAERQGLRLEAPYTASAVVDLVEAVPWPIRLREPKALARALLRRRGTPEALVSRPKLSFGFPYRYWAAPGALFQPLVDMASAADPSLALAPLQGLEPQRAMLLWNLLNRFLWRRLVLEGAVARDLAAEVLDRHRASTTSTVVG